MDAKEEFIGKFREMLIESFSSQAPELRAQAMGVVALDRLNASRPSILSGMTTLTIGLMHACARHPEWMMGVVRDSHWLQEIYTEEEYESLLQDFISWYPLPRGTAYADNRDG